MVDIAPRADELRVRLTSHLNGSSDEDGEAHDVRGGVENALSGRGGSSRGNDGAARIAAVVVVHRGRRGGGSTR